MADRVCDLCGEPMGDEAGEVHAACADRENAEADLPPLYDLGGSD